MNDTTQPQPPLSQADLDVVRAVFREAKVGDYRGLDDFGDSKTPFHEGWNECLDHCFERLAPTIHADRVELCRLRAVLAEKEHQNDAMRALLIRIEPCCEYVDCKRPGPHVTHSITGTASAAKEKNA